MATVLPPLIAWVIAAALAVDDPLLTAAALVAAVGDPAVPVQAALSGQHAIFPASSTAQLVFWGQQAMLFKLEQSLGHFESRRKRSSLMRPL